MSDNNDELKIVISYLYLTAVAADGEIDDSEIKIHVLLVIK